MGNNRFVDIFKEFASKKYIANILVLIGIAIMVLIVSKDTFLGNSKKMIKQENTLENTLAPQEYGERTEEELIEYRLKNILENIEGVGDVEIMITFEMGAEIIPASNKSKSSDTTEEKDSGGGARTIVSEDITETVVMTNENYGTKLLVLKEIKPKVNGVIVVAKGAENIEVKARLYDAVKTVLQIPGHKVEIYPKKN